MHRMMTPLARLTIIVTTLLSPAATIAAITTYTHDTATRLRNEQDGVSNVVVTALLAGIGAIIVVAYLAIVRGKVESEANNLPASS